MKFRFGGKKQATHPGDLPFDPVPPGGDLDCPGITDAEAGNVHGTPDEYRMHRPGGDPDIAPPPEPQVEPPIGPDVMPPRDPSVAPPEGPDIAPDSPIEIPPRQPELKAPRRRSGGDL